MWFPAGVLRYPFLLCQQVTISPPVEGIPSVLIISLTLLYKWNSVLKGKWRSWYPHFSSDLALFCYGIIESIASTQKILSIVKIVLCTCPRKVTAVHCTSCRMAWREGIFCPVWRFVWVLWLVFFFVFCFCLVWFGLLFCFGFEFVVVVLVVFVCLFLRIGLLPGVIATDLQDLVYRIEHVF